MDRIIEAMKEMDALLQNNTWTLTELTERQESCRF